MIPPRSYSPDPAGRSLSPPWRQSSRVDSSLRPTRSVSPYVRQQLAASYDDAVLEQAGRRHTAEGPQPQLEPWQGHRLSAQGPILRKTASTPWQPPARAVSRTLTGPLQPAPQGQHGPNMAHQSSLGDGTASAAAYVTVQPAGSHKSAMPEDARAAAHHELARLPSSPQVFSQLDWQIMSSILQAADQAAKNERLDSTGNGQVGRMLLSTCCLSLSETLTCRHRSSETTLLADHPAEAAQGVRGGAPPQRHRCRVRHPLLPAAAPAQPGCLPRLVGEAAPPCSTMGQVRQERKPLLVHASCGPNLARYRSSRAGTGAQLLERHLHPCQWLPSTPTASHPPPHVETLPPSVLHCLLRPSAPGTVCAGQDGSPLARGFWPQAGVLICLPPGIDWPRLAAPSPEHAATSQEQRHHLHGLLIIG